MSTFELLSGFAAFIVLFYNYLTWNYDFWKKRGVKGPKPKLITGNLGGVLIGIKSIADNTKQIYDEFKSEPLIGIYGGRSPVLIVNDMDLIKNVLIKDFSVFADRGIKLHEKVCHIFSVNIFCYNVHKIMHNKN